MDVAVLAARCCVRVNRDADMSVPAKDDLDTVCNRDMLFHAQVGILMVGQSGAGLGIITTANAQAAKMFGHSARDMVGQNVHMLLPEPFSSQHQGFMERSLDSGTSVRIGPQGLLLLEL